MNTNNSFDQFINWWYTFNNVVNPVVGTGAKPEPQAEQGIPMWVVYALIGLVAFILILALLFHLKNKTT